MAPKTGRRKQDSHATRSRLEEAALRLFAERGFDGTRAVDVAAAAGVTERTFFRHFASKEEVLLEGHLRVLDRFLDALRDRSADMLPLDALEGAVRSAIRDAGSLEGMLLRGRLMVENPTLQARSFFMLRVWEQQIAGIFERDFSLDPLAAHVLANAGVGALRAAFDAWVLAAGGTDIGELVSDALARLQEPRVHGEA